MSSEAKVTIVMQGEFTTEVEDDGHLGSATTIDKHIAAAKQQMQNTTVLIKQGASEAKPVTSRFKVKSITVVPKDA